MLELLAPYSEACETLLYVNSILKECIYTLFICCEHHQKRPSHVINSTFSLVLFWIAAFFPWNTSPNVEFKTRKCPVYDL